MLLKNLICSLIGTLIMTKNVQTHSCEKLISSLAVSQSDYLMCITKHAVPVTICSSCSSELSSMNTRFEELLNNKTCAEMYFDQDRINLVATTQTLMTELWNKAHCNDCFVDKIQEYFNKLIQNHENCLHQNKINTLCKKCFETYDNVNSFYINLDQKHNGEICYDMQDSMNRTRFHWSKKLNCCRRTFNKTLFIMASCFVGVLPILFYFGIFAFTRHRDRNHDVLYEPDTPRQNQTIRETVTGAPPITATQSVQNSLPISKSKLKEERDSDSDCSIDNKKEISK